MKKFFLIASAAFTMAAACQVGYDKTPSGLVYKIYSGDGKDSIKAGEFVKLNISFSIPDKHDTMLSTTFGKVPGFIMVDTSSKANYSFMEVLTKCKVGDSAVVKLSVDSLKNRNAIQYNDIFEKGGTLQCNFKVLGTFKNESEVMADFQKEGDIENQREIKSIEKYMSDKNIKGIKTTSGAYVAVETPGDQSVKADSGMVATIKYKGYLQSNGKVFDTNFDTSKGHSDPIKVTVGSHGVIPAWEEALPYFGKGSSGKILVPAFLGYGPQGAPPEIPPYSNIIFDIQVLDVQPAAAVTTPPDSVNPKAPGASEK